MSPKMHNAYMAYITCSFNDLYYYGVYSLSTEYRVELYCFRIPVQTTNTPSLQGESSSNIRRGRIGTTQSKDPEDKCSGVFVAWQKMCPSDSPCMLYHWNDTKPETEKQVSFDTSADYYSIILLRCLILLIRLIRYTTYCVCLRFRFVFGKNIDCVTMRYVWILRNSCSRMTFYHRSFLQKH